MRALVGLSAFAAAAFTLAAGLPSRLQGVATVLAAASDKASGELPKLTKEQIDKFTPFEMQRALGARAQRSFVGGSASNRTQSLAGMTKMTTVRTMLQTTKAMKMTVGVEG